MNKYTVFIKYELEDGSIIRKDYQLEAYSKIDCYLDALRRYCEENKKQFVKLHYCLVGWGWGNENGTN